MANGVEAKQTHSRYFKTRINVVLAVGFGLVVLAEHWVWAFIAALMTLFLVFALDDEARARHSAQDESEAG